VGAAGAWGWHLAALALPSGGGTAIRRSGFKHQALDRLSGGDHRSQLRRSVGPPSLTRNWATPASMPRIKKPIPSVARRECPQLLRPKQLGASSAPWPAGFERLGGGNSPVDPAPWCGACGRRRIKGDQQRWPAIPQLLEQGPERRLGASPGRAGEHQGRPTSGTQLCQAGFDQRPAGPVQRSLDRVVGERCSGIKRGILERLAAMVFR